jgi:predicted nucleic acid-binding protein
MRLCLDTNILIDVLKGEPSTLAWLEQQQRPAVSLITWMEVLVGCQPDEAPVVKSWLEGFDRIAVDPCVASAQCSGLVLATRNTRDFPLRLGGVLHPYEF